MTGIVVFPAHAGMSPDRDLAELQTLGFPRTRGDEPVSLRWGTISAVFSPHTRG